MISVNRRLHDQIASLPPEECTFQTTFQAIAEASNKFIAETSPLIFYTHVTTDKDVREASIAAEEALDKYAVEVEMRVDVYKALLAAEKNINYSTLSPEQKRLVEKMLLEGKRAGLNLPDTQRDRLKKASLCHMFRCTLI